MKKIVICSVIMLYAGLQFSMNFAAEQPQEQKGYMQRLKEWIGKMYENAPSGKKVVSTVGILTASREPEASVLFGNVAGSYMVFQGVKQAWDAILNGNIGSSLAAGPLLAAGLNYAFIPMIIGEHKIRFIGERERDYEKAGEAFKAFAAIGLGVTAAGLISAVYHNLIAPVNNGEIPKTKKIDETLKDVTRTMVKVAIDDDAAYPTRSTKMNALLKGGNELLHKDDTDGIVLEACNHLIEEITKEFLQKSPAVRDKQDEEENVINASISKIRDQMIFEKITRPANQIEFLMKELKKFTPQDRAVVSLLLRLRNGLAIDLGQGTRGTQEPQRQKRGEMAPKEKAAMEQYAKERTEMYSVPKK